MKISNLVNGYVLPNLFCDLLFLQEDHGIDVNIQDWDDKAFVSKVIHDVVLPRFHGFKPETQAVVRNTLRYLLATKSASDEAWDIVWETSSAPIPLATLKVRGFVEHCYELLFDNEPLPSAEELKGYHVNHEMQLANRLN
ncbi:hypothetical protein ACSFBF_16665 [Variovorax sp. ZT5P49]|uniref:hypothetical protein n=1 Tax=Variovorax sp. ZT5P49 TaxID=3443733 RepID=UPI003F45250B